MKKSELMYNYLLQYSDLENLTLREFKDRIEKLKGVNLKDLRISDLTFYNGNPILPSEGVYIFREGKSFVYVGKVTSMSFTERIPKHFDTRTFAWFNRLLKIICEKKTEKEITNENLVEASKFTFDNLNLILINFKKRERINPIEKLLRASTNTLNKFKTLRITDNNLIIKNYE